MREINKIAEGLFEKIRDRFEDVSLGDEKAKATSDPERARFFNFDYVVDGHNHGNITMSLIDETSLKVYYSKNISDDLDKEHKKEWYNFLHELREFARRNLLSFEPRDITRSTLKHRDIQQQSKADSTYDKDEVVAESKLYGTSKSSYQKFGPARIIVRHDKHVTDESYGDRSRHINSIYVENHEGERFKMPFRSLTASRAMARHVSAGGTPHDELGQHICEMAMECAKLKPFLNNVRHRMFEDEETKTMVEAAFEYHKLLKNTLQRMGGKKGYTTCKEQFVATSTSYVPEEDVDLNEIKERFVKRVFNDKMEDALPLVHKAYNMKKENKFTEQFENWASAVAEGSWALPNSDDEVGKLIDLLSEPLPVGVDAQNATNALYNIIGDDRLFDRLEEYSKIDPTADARDVIMPWLQDNLPHIYQQIENEIGDPDHPAEPADSEGGDVDEGTYGSSDSGTDGVVYEEHDYCDACDHTADKCICEDDYDDVDDSEQVCIYCGTPRRDKIGCCDENHWTTKGEFDKEEVNEDNDDQDDLLANIEAIQSAIIRRIVHGKHHKLLMKLGPQGVMEKSLEVAEFAAPVEEIGSSDVSGWVRQIERDADIEQEHSDLHEAFERALNEAAINVGDIIRDRTQPEISGKVVGDMEENYTIQVDGETYHIKKLNAEKVNGLNEDQVSDKLQSLIGQQVYVKSEGRMGEVVGVAKDFRNGLIIQIGTRQTVAHIGDLTTDRPGPVKQVLDWLNSVTGGGTMAPRKATMQGNLPMDMKEDILKLAGLK